MIDTYTIYGGEGIDQGSRTQMDNAIALPSARKAALMPDAHLGYGLPIGGVLATEGTILPYGVGMDIACRMRITLAGDAHPLTVQALIDNCPQENRYLDDALTKGTRFGMGNDYTRSGRQNHPVMDDPEWDSTPFLKGLKDKAWNQLGTSGGGNHFVEFGIVEGLGTQGIALMSHSGSRGSGHAVCVHFTRIAKELNPAGELSWLDLNTEAGQEYWHAMNLMGRYAAANHEVIHRNVFRIAGLSPTMHVENHHNFAWMEKHDGKDLIVHRKGATPAGLGDTGVIPGSMATSAYIVKGKGNADSICSASHGAGRLMSRSAAKKAFSWPMWQRYLDVAGVRLLQGGLDEVPGAYKPIDEVMAAQTDLVEVVGRFSPKIVMMAAAQKRGRR
jgi:tRNA-splicing ligase RtcB